MSANESAWPIKEPPRDDGHRLLAGVDHVRIEGGRVGRRAHSEETVLAVKDDLAPLRDMIGDQGRYADAQVDVAAIGNVDRDSSRNLGPGPSLQYGSVNHRDHRH